MGHGVIDHIGQRFGRLTVLGISPRRSSNRSVWWRCRCDCGTVKDCPGRYLRAGRTTSCGCWKRRTLAACPQCGKEFWPWENGWHKRKHCSGRCAALHTTEKNRKNKPPLAPRTCLWCGNEVRRGSRRFYYCSYTCYRRMHTRLHHLRRRGLKRKRQRISLVAIYKRDRGRCGLCGGRVLKHLRPNHPRSATIDHIVPLALGGDHTLDNVQLAHFACNSRKRARPSPAQTKLFR